jgi:hypothetical protein
LSTAAETFASAAKEVANARDKAEAIAAAVSARAKRGAAGDDKLDLKDLKAVVKFTHIVLGKTGFSKFNTKVLCLQFLAAVSPAWDTLLPAVSESGAPAPAPPAAAPAPVVPVVFLTPPPATTPRPSIDVSSLSQAEQRELLKQLSYADAKDGNKVFAFFSNKNQGQSSCKVSSKIHNRKKKALRGLEVGVDGLDEFSTDLEHLYIATGSGITRINGLGSVYTSDPLFEEKVAFQGQGGTATTPTFTTATKILSGSWEGIAINPNDDDDLLILPGFNGTIKRSSNASSATTNGLATINLGSVGGVACYDGIINREDPDVLVIGTSSGMVISINGGSTFTNSSAGFEGTPVFEVRQSWRTYDEGSYRPGEIYIGTYGRGIWSSTSYLGIDDSQTTIGDKKEFKFHLVPNPTTSSTSISVNLDNTSDVEIEVYNINGSRVKAISKKNLSSGNQTIDIDASNLNTGTYIVKLVASGKVATSKFIKL